MKRIAVAGCIAAAAVASAAASAAADDDFHGAQVVYAKGTSLWKTDAKGKAKPVELAALPGGARAEDVAAIRSDAGGHTLVVELGGTWYWTRVDGDAATPLTAIGGAAGGAALAGDGACVVCATDKGTASIHKLGSDAHLDRDVPAAGAGVAGAATARTLIWADPTGVWSAPAAAAAVAATQKKALATDAPLAHFSPAPDGAHALGVYKAHDEKDAPLLYSFALDGSGARRKVIRNGVPIEWSWDSQWVLVQDGGSACVMRAIGGEYKCWKGYTAVGIAEDGAWALVLGPRDQSAAGKSDAKPKGKGKGKGKNKGKAAASGDDEAGATPVAGDDESEDGDGGAIDETVVPLPKRPFSLYRARRDGAYTDRPVAIVRDVDGPAAWLPAPASP